MFSECNLYSLIFLPSEKKNTLGIKQKKTCVVERLSESALSS